MVPRELSLSSHPPPGLPECFQRSGAGAGGDCRQEPPGRPRAAQPLEPITQLQTLLAPQRGPGVTALLTRGGGTGPCRAPGRKGRIDRSPAYHPGALEPAPASCSGTGGACGEVQGAQPPGVDRRAAPHSHRRGSRLLLAGQPLDTWLPGASFPEPGDEPAAWTPRAPPTACRLPLGSTAHPAFLIAFCSHRCLSSAWWPCGLGANQWADGGTNWTCLRPCMPGLPQRQVRDPHTRTSLFGGGGIRNWRSFLLGFLPGGGDRPQLDLALVLAIWGSHSQPQDVSPGLRVLACCSPLRASAGPSPDLFSEASSPPVPSTSSPGPGCPSPSSAHGCPWQKAAASPSNTMHLQNRESRPQQGVFQILSPTVPWAPAQQRVLCRGQGAVHGPIWPLPAGGTGGTQPGLLEPISQPQNGE